VVCLRCTIAGAGKLAGKTYRTYDRYKFAYKYVLGGTVGEESRSANIKNNVTRYILSLSLHV